MSGKEANQHYPKQLQLPDDYIAIFEGDGGILRANKALAAMQVCVCVCWIGIECSWECPSLLVSAGYILFCLHQELFVRHGGELLDRHKVIGIVPGPVVTVQTEKGDFKANRVILTVGPWTNSLLKKISPGLGLPLQVQLRDEIPCPSVANKLLT